MDCFNLNTKKERGEKVHSFVKVWSFTTIFFQLTIIKKAPLTGKGRGRERECVSEREIRERDKRERYRERERAQESLIKKIVCSVFFNSPWKAMYPHLQNYIFLFVIFNHFCDKFELIMYYQKRFLNTSNHQPVMALNTISI